MTSNNEWTEHINFSVLRRFYDHAIVQPNGCVTWDGGTNDHGYGRMAIRLAPYRNTNVLVHRLSFFLVHGYLTEGLVIDHLCRMPLCVNPTHLEEVTDRINTYRGESPLAARRHQTHCLRGHEYTADTTYRSPTTGTRRCRACRRVASLREAS